MNGNAESGDHLDELLNNPDAEGTTTDAAPEEDAPEEGGDNPDLSPPSGDTDSGDSGDGESDSGAEEGAAPVTRDDLDRAAQRIADRTVNAVLKDLRGTRKGNKPDQQRRSSGEDEQRGQDRAGSADPSDTREARMAFREYVTDRHRFVDPAEREIANTLGGHVIGQQLTEHGDPDRAGRAAADSVAEQLGHYRRSVEKATVAALRKRGALADTPNAGRGGGSAPPGQAPSPASLADKRTAARSAAERINAQRGHEQTGQHAG